MSSLANIPIDQIVQNNLSDHEKSKLSSLEKIAQEFHLYINDSEYDSISAFKALCQEQIKSNDVKVIIVDCLQSIKSRIDGKKNNLTASALINELKGLVKEHNILVIASSQLNKALESRGGDKRPQLSDLTDSGLLEEVADKVIFIYRAEYYSITIDEDGRSTRGVAELMMVKNRNGKVGRVELLRDINFR